MSRHSMREFDPGRVAALDAQMWKAYYAHDFLLLMRLLITLFKEQFGVNNLTAFGLAYYSMRAAMVFRKTGNLPLAEKYLKKYYRLLRRHASEEFDTDAAARTEIEWWVIHRYPSRGSLQQALADNMAALYALDPLKLLPYAKQRAKAMELRDFATHKAKREPDWESIQDHLQKSYTALSLAVKVQK